MDAATERRSKSAEWSGQQPHSNFKAFSERGWAEGNRSATRCQQLDGFDSIQTTGCWDLSAHFALHSGTTPIGTNRLLRTTLLELHVTPGALSGTSYRSEMTCEGQRYPGSLVNCLCPPKKRLTT